MITRPRTDWTIPLAGASTIVLLALVGITAATGISQETFEIVRSPDVYAAGLRDHPVALRALFGLDSAFLILYASFLIGFGRRIATSETRTFVAIAVGCVLGTAVLDMIEDHHILAMLSGALDHHDPGVGEIAL